MAQQLPHWWVGTMPNGEIHVIPLNDLVDHTENYTHCVCGPTEEPVLRPETDTVAGFSHVHHSLDGRERFE